MWVAAAASAAAAEEWLISDSEDAERSAQAALDRFDGAITTYKGAVDAFWAALPIAVRDARQAAPSFSQHPGVQMQLVSRIRWKGEYFDVDSENVRLFRTGEFGLQLALGYASKSPQFCAAIAATSGSIAQSVIANIRESGS
jgi:hypothetical protein